MTTPINAIKTLVNQFAGKASIIISENGVNVLAIKENEVIRSASLIKLAVLNTLIDSHTNLDTIIEIDDQALVAGSGVISVLRPQKLQVRKLMSMMISVSDNSATNILINYIGGIGVVNQWLKSAGFKSTQLNRMMMDTNALQAGRDNFTTAIESLALFKRALTRSSEINSWFINQQFRYKLPGNFDELGLKITVANKTGEGQSLDHDVAQFIYGDQTIDIALLTSDFANRSDTISLFNQVGQLIASTILNK